MSQQSSSPIQPASTQASTSTNPLISVPASYHPQPRPVPMPPFERIDTQQIKQDLHDALGEHGLPYWKAVNGYLLGQVGRTELMELTKGWLKGDRAQLHNRLLTSLLYNASASPTGSTPTPNKRKRVGPEDPEFDIDETFIEPKDRIRRWITGISTRDGNRIKRQMIQKNAFPPIEERVDVDMAKKIWPTFQPDTVMPALSVSSRQLPSSLQLSQRLAQLCKTYNLTVGNDSANDIGDLLAIGIDTHLGGLLHSLVHMTGKERPGGETVRIPKGIKEIPAERMDLDEFEYDYPTPPNEDDGDIPQPDLETLRTLFTHDRTLHPSASSTLYKLDSGHTISEAELSRPSKSTSNMSNGSMRTGMMAPFVENHAKRLLDGGLLKMDKGRASDAVEEGGKKDKKHSLHWKYEDPAIILKDILG